MELSEGGRALSLSRSRFAAPFFFSRSCYSQENKKQATITHSENHCDSIFHFHLLADSKKAFASLSSILSRTRRVTHCRVEWEFSDNCSSVALFDFDFVFLQLVWYISISLSVTLITHASIIDLFFQVYIEPIGIFQFNFITMNRKSNSFSVVIFTLFFFYYSTFHVLCCFVDLKSLRKIFPIVSEWGLFCVLLLLFSCSVSGGHIF